MGKPSKWGTFHCHPSDSGHGMRSDDFWGVFHGLDCSYKGELTGQYYFDGDILWDIMAYEWYIVLVILIRRVTHCRQIATG